MIDTEFYNTTSLERLEEIGIFEPQPSPDSGAAAGGGSVVTLATAE